MGGRVPVGLLIAFSTHLAAGKRPRRKRIAVRISCDRQNQPVAFWQRPAEYNPVRHGDVVWHSLNAASEHWRDCHVGLPVIPESALCRRVVRERVARVSD